MGFGVCIVLSDPKYKSTYATAVNALRCFGWSLVATCSRNGMSDWEGWIQEQKIMCIPYNESPSEIFPFAAVNDFTYVLSIGEIPVENSQTNTIQILLDEKCSLIVTEPEKPTSRSFQISSDPQSWEEFVLAMIRDGAPLTATCLNDTVCVFKNNSIHNKNTVIRTFGGGNGKPGKIRLKPLWNFSPGSSRLIELWSKYFVGTKFQLVDANPDFFLVINAPMEAVDPARTIYFMMEPHGEVQYGAWLNSVGDKLLFNGSHKNHLNNCEWHCSWTLPEALQRTPPGDRTRGLSIIISDKANDPGQKYRIEIAKGLDSLQKSGQLPFPLEIWGKCSSLNFSCYKGEIGPYNKDSVLEKFSHHFNAENHAIHNYVTEKLYDSILSGCHTLYWGAPNATTFFPPNSFTQLTGNVEQDVAKIIQTVRTQPDISAIATARAVILKNYTMPRRIEKILEINATTVIFMNSPQPQAAISQGFKHVATSSLKMVDFSWIAGLSAIYKAEPILMIFDKATDSDLFSKMCRLLYALPDEIDFIHMSSSGKLEGFSGYWYLRPTAVEKAVEMDKSGVKDHRILSALKTVVCKI